MNRRWRRALTVGAAAAVIVGGTVAVASGDDGSVGRSAFNEQLSGYQEDPSVCAVDVTVVVPTQIDLGQQISYTLSYSALEGNVLQAHIHLGGRHQSGGISAFLCTNLGNGPAGTQTVPGSAGHHRGRHHAGRRRRSGHAGHHCWPVRRAGSRDPGGATYVNVHSSLYQGGEIRAQLGDHSLTGKGQPRGRESRSTFPLWSIPGRERRVSGQQCWCPGRPRGWQEPQRDRGEDRPWPSPAPIGARRPVGTIAIAAGRPDHSRTAIRCDSGDAVAVGCRRW